MSDRYNHITLLIDLIVSSLAKGGRATLVVVGDLLSVWINGKRSWFIIGYGDDELGRVEKTVGKKLRRVYDSKLA